MIIESINGIYYCNPIFLRPDWVLQVRDECPTLFLPVDRKSRKVPKELKIEYLQQWQNESMIMGDGKLKVCEVYTFSLVKPLPKPDKWLIYYTDQLPDDQTIWTFSWPFSANEILDYMKGKPNPFLEEFLDGNARRKIRQQFPVLVGARITDLNYVYYLGKLPPIVKLAGRKCREFVPGLAGPLAKTV